MVISSSQKGWEKGVPHLEVQGVVGVRHQLILIRALQLEAMCDPAVRGPVLAIAVKVGEAVDISELFEVFVCAVHSSCTQVLHHTCFTEKTSVQQWHL